MIKRLQIRFVRIVMEAFLAVLIVVLVGINCVSRYTVYSSLDTRLAYLAESTLGPPRGMIATTPYELQRWLNLNNAGIMSESSYFIFSDFTPTDRQNQQLGMLSLMIDQNAGTLLNDILSGDETYGNIAQYRYYVASRGEHYRVVFLFCENEFSSMRTLLRTSLLVGLSCFVVVLALVTLLSKKAIRPFAQNIESQKRFISNASHELKTPLGVIISDLDLQILEGGKTEWLENAQLQADHLALLVDQLTAYALLDEKSGSDDVQPVDLSALGQGLMADFQPLALSGGQTLSGEITPGITLPGNVDILRTLLSVLLNNAIKYTPPGGFIRLSIRREKRVVIQSENTCEDITDKELERLFERFYRASQHRAGQSGSGLGLSIAQDIVSRYGGSIQASKGEGTILFTVKL